MIKDQCVSVTDLIEMPEDEVTPELVKMAEEAKRTPKKELLNIGGMSKILRILEKHWILPYLEDRNLLKQYQKAKAY
ncbi:MAG: hypothetical protein WC924_03725 [Candidatus Gracilibacteria bacterium]